MSKYLIKITELDKKILYELDKDGRASYSKIARAINTTPQVVKYHYERLMDYKVIKKIWAFIDYDLAGYSFFWGYWMKFTGLTTEKEKEMYNFFKNHKYIPIVMRCDGYADVMLGLIAKNVFQHNKILKEIYNNYGKNIAKNDIVVGLGFEKFPRSYLIDKPNTNKKVFLSGGTDKTVSLDKIDRQIMSLLQIDGRYEFTAMAKILNVSVDLVYKHYKKLVKQNVITKTAYTLNYKVIGIKLYRVLFKLIKFDQERTKALYDFCATHQNINNYVKVMGNWDLMLDIEIKNREELRDLIRMIKHDFEDIISRVEINDIYSMDKFTQMVIEYPDLINNKK